MDCNLPCTSFHGDSPSNNTGVGSHALLQGTFSTQGSNPGLPHCRWILYHLNFQGSPRIVHFMSLNKFIMIRIHHYSITQSSFPTKNHWKSSVLHLLIPLSPNIWKPVIFFTVLIVLPFPECHIAGIIQYGTFSGWFLSLSNMDLYVFMSFHGLKANFLLRLNNMPLSGCTTFYPFTYWKTP